jgi:hypothetical protein
VIIEGTGSTFELKFLPLKNPFSEPQKKVLLCSAFGMHLLDN